MTKQIRLKKDIVIPAGTIMGSAPSETVRMGDGHFNHVFGLTNDSSGTIEYYIDEDDEFLDDWFEDAVYPEDKYKAVREAFKDGDYVKGLKDGRGVYGVTSGMNGMFKPFTYYGDTDPSEYRKISFEEMSDLLDAAKDRFKERELLKNTTLQNGDE